MLLDQLAARAVEANTAQAMKQASLEILRKANQKIVAESKSSLTTP